MIQVPENINRNSRETIIYIFFKENVFFMGVFENSDAVAEGFAYARYFHQTGINPEWETNPLVKLGEKLMQEHAMLDFHKIVLDTDYRKSLWKRP